MTQIRLLPEAEEELQAAARFYEALRLGLGLALLQEVRRARERIAERPRASRIERGDIRVRSILRFPYRLYYRVRANVIVIIAVGHRRRRPGFWRSRT
jgi:toxin ParE1/3/4